MQEIIKGKMDIEITKEDEKSVSEGFPLSSPSEPCVLQELLENPFPLCWRPAIEDREEETENNSDTTRSDRVSNGKGLLKAFCRLGQKSKIMTMGAMGGCLYGGSISSSMATSITSATAGIRRIRTSQRSGPVCNVRKRHRKSKSKASSSRSCKLGLAGNAVVDISLKRAKMEEPPGKLKCLLGNKRPFYVKFFRRTKTKKN